MSTPVINSTEISQRLLFFTNLWLDQGLQNQAAWGRGGGRLEVPPGVGWEGGPPGVQH